MIIGFTASMLSSSIFKFVFPIYIYFRTSSSDMMIWSYLAMFLPNLMATPVTGLLAQRFMPKVVLIILDCCTIFFGLLVYFAITTQMHINYLLLFAFLSSCCSCLFLPSYQGAVSYLFEREKELICVKAISTVTSLSKAIGPAFGGAMAFYLSYEMLFLVVCLFSLVSLLILALLTFTTKVVADKTSFKNVLVRGIAEIKQNPFILFVLKRFFITGVFFHAFQSVFIFYLKDALQLTDTQVGYLFAFAVVGMLIVSIYGGGIFKKINKWYLLTIGGVLSALCLLTIPFIENGLLIAMVWCVVMSLSVINSIVFNTEKQIVIAKEQIGNVSALASTLLSLSIPIGTCVALLANAIFSIRQSIMLFALLLLISGIYFLIQAILVVKKDKNTVVSL